MSQQEAEQGLRSANLDLSMAETKTQAMLARNNVRHWQRAVQRFANVEYV